LVLLGWARFQSTTIKRSAHVSDSDGSDSDDSLSDDDFDFDDDLAPWAEAPCRS
jgi:hypothetical protein